MFRLTVHESDGQAYENLFVKIMGYAHRRFRPVKAQGSTGDKKNDGFDSSLGTYYQVYAPDEIRRTQGDALKKLKTDFKGLKAFGDGLYPVKRYFFVINDKYQGVSPTIEAELVAIKTNHSLTEADVFLAKDLEETLFGLPDDKVIAVVGHVPMIAAQDFLFLSGFAYFIGTWIEFELTLRERYDPPQSRIGRPWTMRKFSRALHEQGLIDRTEAEWLQELFNMRSQLVHGDTLNLPPKSEIDRLVILTEKVKAKRS
jgi:hypothetical protein